MIILNTPCVRCKNSFENTKMGRTRCKAFPNGIPYEYLWKIDVTELEECNNGYKFEEEGIKSPVPSYGR